MRGNGEDPGQPIKVEVPPEVKAHPVNFMYVTHTPYDFTIDFAHIVPTGDAEPRARVSDRVVISPAFVHRLVQTLMVNIEKYEATFGPIVSPSVPGNEQGDLR